MLLGNRRWEEFVILLARVSLGVFFAISGGNKLFAGCLLVIGLLTSLSCAALNIQMIVAITTVQIAMILKHSRFSTGSTSYSICPKHVYIVILIWLICSGPGKLSLGSLIAHAFGYQDSQN